MSQTSFEFQWTAVTLIVSITAIAAVAGLAAMAWVRSRYRPAVLGLESIRVALVLLAVLLLNQPETIQQFRPEERPQVVILADATRSMDTQDVVAAPEAADGQSLLTRRQAIAPLLDPQRWSGLADDYEVVVSRFGIEEGAETDLHSALETVRQAHANLRAVVLLSDGDWNAGLPPVEAASRLRMHRVPVFAVPVGSQTRLPDLALISFDVPAFGIVHKSVRLPFTIESSLPRDHAAVVRLMATDGTQMEHPVQIAAMGRTSDAIVWHPESVGNFTLTLEVAPHPDERITDNNRRDAPIAIREEQLKVLVVESLPRWEYRYLRNALSRDPGVEVRCLLFHPGLSKVGGGNRDYLPAFPERLEELSEYDVVFLGDVGIEEGELTWDQCELLRGLVEQQASGLVFMPGPQGKMLSLIDSPLDALLPVTLD
ncbi:MAG: VWA domain-containing protein, partial [Planctomycetota bacterium]